MLFCSMRKQQGARGLSKYSLSLLKLQKYSGKREELHEAETLPHLPLTLANKAGQLCVGEITGESSGSTSGKVPLFLSPSKCLFLFSYAATKNEQQKEQQKKPQHIYFTSVSDHVLLVWNLKVLSNVQGLPTFAEEFDARELTKSRGGRGSSAPELPQSRGAWEHGHQDTAWNSNTPQG